MFMMFYLNVFYWFAVLFTDIEASCWTIQDVESSDVLVYTNDVLQCLYSIAYKTGK